MTYNVILGRKEKINARVKWYSIVHAADDSCVIVFGQTPEGKNLVFLL